jgi:hypothetical protein
VTPIERANDLGGEGISRRKLLKRIGVGVAVAWTAPIITSISTPAFAQASGVCQGCPSTGCPGSDFQPCDGGGCVSGACYGGLGCFTFQDNEGNCLCLQNELCSCAASCTSSSDCGPCQHCISNTGCGSGGVCADCCGQNCHRPRGGPKSRSGRTLTTGMR